MTVKLPESWMQELNRQNVEYKRLFEYGKRKENSEMNAKQNFMENVTVLCDSREKRNNHIINFLDSYHIKHQKATLELADYSFLIDGIDFSTKFSIERKGSIDELFGNVTHDRARFEREIANLKANQGGAVLVLERCPSLTALKSYRIDDETAVKQHRKIQNIGEVVYNTVMAWSLPNKYGLTVHYVENPAYTGSVLLSLMYHEYQNYKACHKACLSCKE